MWNKIAVCGLDCANCDIYKATQANDPEFTAKVVEKVRTEYGDLTATAETLICDGCLAGQRMIGYCAQCEIRACGAKQGVSNCAECADFEGCEKIIKFMEMVPDVKVRLTEMRASRN